MITLLDFGVFVYQISQIHAIKAECQINNLQLKDTKWLGLRINNIRWQIMWKFLEGGGLSTLNFVGQLKFESISKFWNASSDIKFGIIVCNKNFAQIYKMIEPYNAPPINAAKNSAMTYRTKDLGFVGIYLRYDSACPLL